MSLSIPVVKDQPHSFSRAGVGHTEVYQQHQAGVWGVEQTNFQVQGFPQQHLQGLVILRVVAFVLGIYNKGGNHNSIQFKARLKSYIHL